MVLSFASGIRLQSGFKPFFSIFKPPRNSQNAITNLSQTLTLTMATLSAPNNRSLTCPSCSRPTQLCLCTRLKTPILETSIAVTVPQHSLEKKHPLNSAKIATLGLKNVNLASISDVLSEAHFNIHLLQSNLDIHFEDDPPFSPIPKTLKPQNQKNNKEFNEDASKKNNFPLKSDLPFDFRYSYSEINPSIEPIGYRETPKFSPFGPGRLDRKWTGTAAPSPQAVDTAKVEEQRNAVLGEPLSEEEVSELVERYRHNDCSRQINLGKGGVTHNMIDDIHNHWKKAKAVRIKCLGVPTLDMDNVCFHLEDKSGGKIIYRQINILLLYRGRNYDPKSRPVIPLMLWKPYPPIYPKLVKNVADGLTFEETKEMRNRGLNTPPLMKLMRNGVYANVVERVREAFEAEEVLRLDCAHVGMSDCKRIAVKLRDLVPCVPILYKDEQIVLWRGKKTIEPALDSC